MKADRLTFESRREKGGSYTTTVRSAEHAADLAGVLARLGAARFDPAIETPLDALLRSGRFAALLPEIAAATRSSTATPGGATVAPLVRPTKILALGRTYREHALELHNAPPTEPLIFEKLADGLAGDRAVVSIPGRADGRMDFEAELALVIGSVASMLPAGNGRGVIAGVTIANDLTLRSVQKAAQKAGHPWLLAKNFPGACVLGPVMTAVDASTGLDALEIVCRVGGEVRQRSSTSALLWPVGRLVEWISQCFPLHPGDIVLTGTPAGTGPLQKGERCDITISGEDLDLGTLAITVG